MTGNALMERLKRYARYCAHLLGGAHHVNLVGKPNEALIDSLANVPTAPPTVLSTNGITEEEDIEDSIVVPWQNVPFYEPVTNYEYDELF